MATAVATPPEPITTEGEVVYSSDGLEPIPVKPPKIEGPKTGIGEEDAVFDSEEVSPQLAFEVFQGKRYTTATGGSRPVIGSKETTLERLARLQQEVQEVENELKASSSAATMGRDFDEELVKLATTLQTQVSSLQQHNQSKVLEHDDLTRLIRDQLAELQKTPAGATPSGGMPDTGVVYELYGNASNPTTTLEDRLVQLEKVVGQSAAAGGSSSALAPNASGASHKTLLHRLEELETLVKTVDPATMEQTTTKAKVIRADLEAASKAKNKLTATYKKEDSKMIQELHTQMVELEGLSGYLPSLVERLQQLAGLHLQASTFAGRLEAMETSANQLSSTVGQLEASVDQLSINLSENLKVMEGNLRSLDSRLNQL